jgi:hypothetical protein
MKHGRSLLLAVLGAVVALAVVAPMSVASTTVEPAGEEVAGVSSGVTLSDANGNAFECGASWFTAEVPAEPANFAEEGPVAIATSPPGFSVCVVRIGGPSFPPSWGANEANGPWSFGAEAVLDEETLETKTFLNLHTSPRGLVVSVPALACTVTFFTNGEELAGTFNNVTQTVTYNEAPIAIDESKCGGPESIAGSFTGSYHFEGLSIA